jgi:hypothetical protein
VFYGEEMPDADKFIATDPAHFLRQPRLCADKRWPSGEGLIDCAFGEDRRRERIAARLERDGYVIIQRPGASALSRGFGER